MTSTAKAASKIQALARGVNFRSKVLPEILVEDEATKMIVKKTSVANLLKELKALKSAGIYTDKISGLKKNEIVNRLQSINYDFRNLSIYAKTPKSKTPKSKVPKSKVPNVPYRKYGSITKNVNRYEKSGNTQLEKAIKAEKAELRKVKKAEKEVIKAEKELEKTITKIEKAVKNKLKPPKMVVRKNENVPYRKYGSIKKAVNRYETYGNTQLEKAIQAEKSKVLAPKKRGRPRKNPM